MEIELKEIGKRYGNRWVFKNISYRLENRNSLAICGRNGSGKSTLLKAIANFLSPTVGTLTYMVDGTEIAPEVAMLSMAYVGPDQNLIEELTLKEHIEFHSRFKKPKIKKKEMISKAGLAGKENVFVRDFSTGMKQRLKLLFCFYYTHDVLLFDEPTSYMDAQGIQWYNDEMNEAINAMTVVIASNQPHEYELVEDRISLEDYKL